MNKNEKRDFFVLYTLLFIALSSLLVGIFYLDGKSIINIGSELGGDGFREYYQSLIHYSNVLKNIFANLFAGNGLQITQMDYAIGEGNDLLQTMHFILIGDPMNFFSVFIPKEKMFLFYDVCSVLKLYLSGLAFAYLCKTTKQNNWLGITIGSVLYAFCGFNTTYLTLHPFFINATIFLPLVLAGIEKVINDEKPYVLIFSVFGIAITNIYFFYMIVIFAVVYAIVRVIFLKKKFTKLLEIALYSFIGVLLSAVVFLPMFYVLITNSRLSIERTYETSYSLGYFISFFINTFAKTTYVSTAQIGIFGVFGLAMLICKKKDRSLLTLVIICIIFASFPFFGRFFNGMSYESDRWIFGFNLMIVYLITYYFGDIVDVKNNWLILLISGITSYGFCAYYDRDNLKIYVLFILSVIAYVIFNNLVKKQILNRIIVIGVSLINLVVGTVFIYSPMFWYQANKGVTFEQLDSMFVNHVSAVESVDDASFYRYSSDSIFDDTSVLGNHSSTQFYWSVSNNNITNFRRDVGLSDHSSIHYNDYDDRYSLMSLACIKYFVMDKEDVTVPYGYEYLETNDGYDVYVNKNVLPFLYGYDEYITEEDWLTLDLEDRNSAPLQMAILEKESNMISKGSPITNATSINYEINDEKGLLDTNKKTISGSGNLEININSDQKGEYYIVIDNMNSSSSAEFKVSNDDMNTKIIYYKATSHARYSQRHNFIINIGYKEGYTGSVNIQTPGGYYTYDDIRVVCQNVEKEQEYVKELNNVNIKSLDFLTNKVKADISIDKDEVVCLALPYSTGWKAYVDGEKVEILRVNGQYMGLELNKGEHNIEFRYSTPFLKTGAIISCVTAIGLVVYIVKKKKKVTIV